MTAPQSIRGSSTALSFHFPFTIGSLSPVTCTQAVGRLVYSQPVSLAGPGFTVVSPSNSIPALQVLGNNAFQSHLSGTGEAPVVSAGILCVLSSCCLIGVFLYSVQLALQLLVHECLRLAYNPCMFEI